MHARIVVASASAHAGKEFGKADEKDELTDARRIRSLRRLVEAFAVRTRNVLQRADRGVAHLDVIIAAREFAQTLLEPRLPHGEHVDALT